MHLLPAWLRSWWKEERHRSRRRAWRGRGLQVLAAGLLVLGLLRCGADPLPALLLLAGLLTLRIQQQLGLRRLRLEQDIELKRSQERLRRSNHQLDALLRQLGGPQLVEELESSPNLELKIQRLASRLERRLQSARSVALVDQLTQLPNRRQFLEQIQVASARARRANQPFAVLFVDIDQFRNLNDSAISTTPTATPPAIGP